MTKLKLVIDTDTWIRALLTDAHPRRVVEFALSDAETFYCKPMLYELIEKLRVQRIVDRTSESEREALLKTIRKRAIEIPTPSYIESVCADSDDDIFFACAVATEANYLISNDSKVLAVSVYKGIYTVTAKHFLEFVLKPAKPKP